MNKLKSGRRRAFTFLELLTVLAIAGLMAAFAVPRFSIVEDEPIVILNRYLSDMRSHAMRNGILVVTSDGESLKALNSSGQPLRSRVQLPAGRWTLDPRSFLFFQDGSCTPGKIKFIDSHGQLVFAVSVVCRAYDWEE